MRADAAAPVKPVPFAAPAELLAAIVESSDDAIISKTLQGIITSWNHGAQRIFGYAPDEIIGRPIEVLIPPELRHEEPEILARISRGDRIDHYQTVRQRKDGSLFDVSVTVSPVRDTEGRIVGASKIAREISEQVRSEAELRRLKEDFRVSFDLAAVGQFQADARTPEALLLRVNSKLGEITGYSETELLGRSILDFCHPDDAPLVRGELDRLPLKLAEGPNTTAFETRLVMPEGGVIWARVSMALMRDQLGRRSRLLGVVEDVSARHASEHKLALYREIFANSVDGIAVIDPSGVYLEQNAAHQRLLGFSADDLRGKTPAVHLGQETFNEVAAALETGPWRGETFSSTRDGRRLPIELSAFPVRDARGRTVCYVGIKRDISERKHSEEELHARVDDLESVHRMTVQVSGAESLEELYSAALLTMRERLASERAAILLFDDDHVMRFKAWRGLSDGYRRAVEGHSPWAADDPHPAPILMPDTAADASLAALQPTLRAEGIRALAFIPLVYESRLLGKLMVYHGEPHAFTAREVRLAQTIANALAIAIERRRADERLERKVQELARSNADLENFAYVTSHDLKEPLRGISSIVGFLQEDLGEKLGDGAADRIARLGKLSHRMYELLDSLLEYSRVGQGEYRVREVDLGALAAETVDTLRARVAAENAVVEVLPGMPTLRCDPLRVTQVLSNLIVNGLKYNTSSPKRVTIGWDPASRAVRVRDNGIGIAPGQQESIFRMFKRLHPGESYGGGTGVGLAIVKKIVERHGGRVWVESAPGQGSAFSFTLGEPGATPAAPPDIGAK